jgi:hypothetical protein
VECFVQIKAIAKHLLSQMNQSPTVKAADAPKTKSRTAIFGSVLTSVLLDKAADAPKTMSRTAVFGSVLTSVLRENPGINKHEAYRQAYIQALPMWKKAYAKLHNKQ